MGAFLPVIPHGFSKKVGELFVKGSFFVLASRNLYKAYSRSSPSILSQAIAWGSTAAFLSTWRLPQGERALSGRLGRLVERWRGPPTPALRALEVAFHQIQSDLAYVGYKNIVLGGAQAFSNLYLEGAKVHGIYNATCRFAADLYRVRKEVHGYTSSSSQKLIAHWESLRKSEYQGIVWVNCFSEGALVVYNAIQFSPSQESQKWIQEHIVVHAYGGAIVVPNKICKDSSNYISTEDHISKWMTRNDPNKKEIRWIEAKRPRWAILPDHAWLSPSYHATKMEEGIKMKKLEDAHDPQ